MPANIDITIKDRADTVTPYKLLTVEMKANPLGHPRVSVDNALGRVQVIPKIKGSDPKDVEIKFTLTNTAPDYFPIGIALVRLPPGSTSDVTLGFSSFPHGKHKADKKSFTITDEYLDPSDIYKFTVFVQRADGLIAIIDPIIIHTPAPNVPPTSRRRH